MKPKINYLQYASGVAIALGVLCGWYSVYLEKIALADPTSPDAALGKTIPYALRGVGTVYISSSEYNYI